MKNKWWIIFIFLFGCHSHKERSKPLPDLPKHFLIPTDAPRYNVQINPVPYPLNIAGSYVVWVNKKRVKLNKQEIDSLVKQLNLSTENPKDTAQIHNGDGWIRPFDNK